MCSLKQIIQQVKAQMLPENKHIGVILNYRGTVSLFAQLFLASLRHEPYRRQWQYNHTQPALKSDSHTINFIILADNDGINRFNGQLFNIVVGNKEVLDVLPAQTQEELAHLTRKGRLIRL